MTAVPLTKEQLKEIQWLREEAAEELRKLDPNVEFMLAGTTLSSGGAQKIYNMLQVYFGQLQKAAAEMQSSGRPSASLESMVDMKIAALGYLAVDRYRHKAGWSLSAQTRALAQQHQEEMDQRARFAAECLKIARSCLGAP